jgi:small-conductance mechanosensitive channel
MSIKDPLFGILVYACALVINRILGEKALKRLTPEEKVKLLDSFAGHRIYSTVAMFILILLFFIVAKASPDSYQTLTWVFLVLLIVMSIGSTLFTYAKLKSSTAPQHYITNFFIRCVVYYVGLVILLVTIASFFPH